MNCKYCKADCAHSGEDRELEKRSCYIPMTNGDRIRSMSDEELAKIISDGGCPPKISEIVCETTDDCNVCWRNWLKQPAEVET